MDEGLRETRNQEPVEEVTPSLGGVAPIQPCDSTAWAGAAKATRAGPGSASSCFKDLNVLEQLVA